MVTICYTLDDGAKAPYKAHKADAGWDIHALDGGFVAQNGTVYRTGLHVRIPDGYYIEVANRSGLNIRHGVTLHGSGTVDAGYTGEILVRLYADEGLYRVLRGDRIAQLILHPFDAIEWVRVDSLEDTDRGDNGFGSTGR